MNRKARFYNIIQTQSLPLRVFWVHFSWADFYRDDCFKGISRLHMFIFCSIHLQVLLVYLFHWNVGHYFKLKFCMQDAQFKTLNQILDYFLALTPALKPMQSLLFVWTVLGGVVVS